MFSTRTACRRASKICKNAPRGTGSSEGHLLHAIHNRLCSTSFLRHKILDRAPAGWRWEFKSLSGAFWNHTCARTDTSLTSLTSSHMADISLTHPACSGCNASPTCKNWSPTFGASESGQVWVQNMMRILHMHLPRVCSSVIKRPLYGPNQ